MPQHEIQIAFLPSYPNPYQAQLAAALAPCGVGVQMLPAMPDGRWLAENRGHVQILHLHWLYGLYMARYKTPIRVARYLRSLAQAQELGYRVVWTAHNILPHRTELQPLHHAIRKIMMQRADAVIVHCTYGEQELRRRYRRDKPTAVIPIGNQIGRFPITMTAAAARASLGLHEAQFVYLFLGLLAPYKGLDDLAREFSRVAAAEDVLLVAGESLSQSVTRQVMAAAAADPRIRVHLGHVPDGEMQRYLLSANALVASYREVLTSSSGTLGLSYGLPVIAPALGCLPETVPPEAGILYDPAAEGSLGAALLAIKDRDATSMKMAAFQAAARLNWGEIGRKTAAVYRNCLGAA